MSQKKSNPTIPGRRSRNIRVLIKKGQEESSVQSSFDLFGEESTKRNDCINNTSIGQ